VTPEPLGVDDVVAKLCDVGATSVVIDGRSGSGKSTLAVRMSGIWSGSTVIGMDHVYPGWDGLHWATAHIESSLLRPRAEDRVGRWRSWSWPRQRPGIWHDVPTGGRLIVEGVGVLTSSSRALIDLAIWVDADDAERKRRALGRRADDYESHWDQWAAHEDEFIRRHHPRRSADLIAVADGGDFTLRTAASGASPWMR
jgi:energy-coupling factor transporter ATP-binding protein EcfA2